MFKNLRGVITFNAVSAEPDKFINTIKNSVVSVHRMSVCNNIISGQVFAHDYNELRSIAQITGTELTKESNKGFVFTVKRYRHRYGIIIGFILAVMLVFYLSNIVMVIEIYGNEMLSDDNITALLDANDIHIGSFIPSIDFREAERLVVVTDDRLAWASIRNIGSRVMVEVSEITEYPEMSNKNLPCNIIATHDAQVVRIENLHQGQLVPMLYDGVKKGDMLVNGVIETTYGGSFMVHSIGTIIGQYTDKVVFTQNYHDEYTDYKEDIKKKSLYIFGLKIPLYINHNISENYDYDEELNYFSLFNIKLPVGVVYSEYHPFEIKETDYTEDAAKDILEYKIKMYEKNFYDGEDILIIDREVQYSDYGDCLSVVCKYTLEGNIGAEQDILAKIQ